MKINVKKITSPAGGLLMLAALLGASQFQAIAGEAQATTGASGDVMTFYNGTNARSMTIDRTGDGPYVIRTLEPGTGGRFSQKEMTWLGVATEESQEALAAQLGLDPGVGLVVDFVETNSPAAKAGLQKNDVLTEFDGQPLVVPQQLRKLVQVRKEGDAVKLVYYRAGKKQTVSATLAHTLTSTGWPGGDVFGGGGNVGTFGGGFSGGSGSGRIQMLRDAAANVKFDQEQLQDEIRHAMDNTRQVYRDAQRQSTNADAAMDKHLEEFIKSSAPSRQPEFIMRGVDHGTHYLASVDAAETIMLIRNPNLHLTAHDKDGKLLFDGEIETTEQRAKVPPDMWKKVEPLLKRMNSTPADLPPPGLAVPTT